MAMSTEKEREKEREREGERERERERERESHASDAHVSSVEKYCKAKKIYANPLL